MAPDNPYDFPRRAFRIGDGYRVDDSPGQTKYADATAIWDLSGNRINWVLTSGPPNCGVVCGAVRITLMVRYGNRIQLGVSVLTGFFLLATLFAVLFYALTTPTPADRGPLVLTGFIAILIGS